SSSACWASAARHSAEWGCPGDSASLIVACALTPSMVVHPCGEGISFRLRSCDESVLGGREPVERLGREPERVAEQPVLAGEVDGAVDLEHRPPLVREREQVDAAEVEARCPRGCKREPDGRPRWDGG